MKKQPTLNLKKVTLADLDEVSLDRVAGGTVGIGSQVDDCRSTVGHTKCLVTMDPSVCPTCPTNNPTYC